MRKYACLTQQIFGSEKYAIVPLRDQDKYDIMQWRNEQIYHLRQAAPLTTQQQEWYFDKVVAQLFETAKPAQLLFSYLENDTCIGYGGLVHINWTDRHAEISFIMKTSLEKDFFEFHWRTYLSLIEKVAFEELNLHKIFTYAFNLRPHLYVAIEKSNYQLEATLPGHCLFEGKFIDVLIHSKFNDINIRTASETDLMRYFNWTNDEEVRKQSFNSQPVVLENHRQWFLKKIKDPNCLMLVFEDARQQPIGQVRFENNPDKQNSIVGVSIDKSFRGKGLAGQLLTRAVRYFLRENPGYTIEAYIKTENKGSIGAFKNAGFLFTKNLDYQGFETVLYTRRNQ
ncbi:GNAT family N-acetyltransferase [Emticicia sp. TH156]|uniref:GNAT family N-acetyltransferase n=1 Tax=Emticicia sp. TH156 TaxID=2067454 RepID=UPI000C758133|nr:GNAT family N-acetyltransferase [Emticicia sp. TH156]PLK42574.1 hypothetical protein C0V77_20315 [Emticicia sp. TH156]